MASSIDATHTGEMSRRRIPKIEDIFNILKANNATCLDISDVKDWKWFHRAFVQKTDCKPESKCRDSNERLEWLGDAVLGLVVTEYLYERFPNEDEGFLTRMRSKLVNGRMLAQLASLLGFQNFVPSRSNAEATTKVLEDTFEAFIGAMHLTMSEAYVRGWIINVIEKNVNMTSLVLNQRAYKVQLTEFLNNKFKMKFTTVDDPSHDTVANPGQYAVLIKDEQGCVLGAGQGSTRRLAEEHACRMALQYHGL